MDPRHQERRLTTILAADVVGYGRLMGSDEAGTLAQLKAHRNELIEPKTAEYHGRVVKLMGDGILMEFGSVVDAVTFAVDVQRAMVERNADVPEGRRIIYRVGINIGDIIVEGEDIYGDGVNLAARLEGLAEPGGICVHGNVWDQVRDKLDLAFDDMGEVELKNIARPARVFRLVLDRADAKADRPAPAGRARPSLPDQPSIAVLPFENLSGDAGQEFFADGITEDIITELSRFPELFVIARNSAFTYKGRAVRIQDVGRDLGVRYVLEGSVRKAGNRVRVTAQLIEAATDNHLWADRFDRELVDIFDLQDEVAQAIVAVLPGRLEIVEANRIKRKLPDDMAAYDCLLAGKGHHHRFTKEDNDKALELLERAIELDPDYAAAYAWKACVLGQALGRGFRPDPEALFARSVEAVAKAISLDANDIECHRILCEIAMVRRQWDQARRHSDRAISLNPNDPRLVAQKGELLSWLGKPEDGAACVRKAVRLDPYSVQTWAHLLGRALLMSRLYEEAIEAYGQSSPPRFGCHADMAGCYAELGKASEVRAQTEETLRLKPDFSISDYVDRLTYRHSQDREHHRDLLRKADLPDRG